MHRPLAISSLLGLRVWPTAKPFSSRRVYTFAFSKRYALLTTCPVNSFRSIRFHLLLIVYKNSQYVLLRKITEIRVTTYYFFISEYCRLDIKNLQFCCDSERVKPGVKLQTRAVRLAHCLRVRKGGMNERVSRSDRVGNGICGTNRRK